MLPDIKKILYASDIESGSRPAFRAAVSLCSQYDAEITFLHVIEPLSASTQSILKTMMNDDALLEMHDQSLDHVRETLEGRIMRFCESELEADEMPADEQIQARVEEGVPDQVILQMADEIDADVIVMGCRKHSAVSQLLLGSTANKVMHQSQRPVLIVPLKKS